MPEALLHHALRDSVNEVLEKMFFVQALGESADSASAESAAEPETAVRLTFRGQPSGSLTLRVTTAAARSIAADFLGAAEDEVSDLQMAQVVCELANMICGSVLSRVESAAVFQLDVPEIVPLPEVPSRPPCATYFAVDLTNGLLAVCMATETSTCLEPVQFAS